VTPPIDPQLVDSLGAATILPPEKLAEYAVDGLTPQIVVRPDNRHAISQVLKWAFTEGKAVVPWGGGTKIVLGNIPQRVDLALDLSRYNRVLDYQPADLTATVETGITLEALQRELASGDKFLPLESPLASRATIGGILATAASGPLRLTYGLARDWLIGISVIGPDGVETKAGGRVVKNVTGYDLNKLYTGSLGTLGVIVEATFKLSPRPAETRAIVASFPSVGQAIDASRGMLSQVAAPQGSQVVNAPLISRLGLTEAAEALVLAFFSGRPRGLQRRMAESTQTLLDRGAVKIQRLEPDESDSLRQRVADLGWSPNDPPLLAVKVNLPPAAVGELIAHRLGQYGNGNLGIIADGGFGTTQLLWWPSEFFWDAPQMHLNILRMRRTVHELGGSMVVEQAPTSVKEQIDIWSQRTSPPDNTSDNTYNNTLEVMRRIKENFDPKGILNPGRFMGGL
jgi:glycolate oxidase FAD binding subunit